MKIRSVVLSALVAVSTLAPAASSAQSAPVVTQALSAQPITLPAALQSQINAVIAACNCFSSITAYRVVPRGAAAEVFSSPDILFTILDLDIQLPWAAAGEINAAALAVRAATFGQKALLTKIQQFADPSNAPFRLGAYAWSHPTAPDFCSGETLYLQYFENTGVLFAYRFDSSHEC
ncbi:MAG: hypothetical protein H7138_01255 [Myxococcales bacterium]|nr:hypothetical protein [Myxococcales bacterium]